MRSVAVFGASGPTGVCVVRAAIKKGLSVQALLRDTTKLPEDLVGKVRGVRGDVLNVEDVRDTLIGQDAVIVALQNGNGPGSTTAMSEGLKNILVVMETLSIRVISVCLSKYLFQDANSVPEEWREVTTDQRRMLRALESHDDLLWVAVNPPAVTHDPPSGYTSRRGQNTMSAGEGHMTVLIDGLCRYSTISQQDLGQFLVDCLSMTELYQKTVGVASLPKAR